MSSLRLQSPLPKMCGKLLCKSYATSVKSVTLVMHIGRTDQRYTMYIFMIPNISNSQTLQGTWHLLLRMWITQNNKRHFRVIYVGQVRNKCALMHI